MKLLMILLSVFFIEQALTAEIINSGRSGQNSAKIVYRYKNDVLNKKPDLVVLMAGTNDSINSYAALPPGAFKNNLLKLIKLTQAKGIKMVLVEIPPAYEAYLVKRHKPAFFKKRSAQKRIKDVNDVLASVAKNKKIPLVKIHDLLVPVNDKANCLIRNLANCKKEDGVHPTPKGYAIIAKAVYNVIKKNKLPYKRIVCVGDSITYGVHVKKSGTADIDAETYPGQLAKLLQ